MLFRSISNDIAADALLDCLNAPSRFGRRSAIHACFHLAEWLPSRQEEIADRVRQVSVDDPDELLRDFALYIAKDIETNASQHVDEPFFADEAS